MIIKVFNQYGKIPFAYRLIVSTLAEVIGTQFETNDELSLIFLNNQAIQDINRQYRHLDAVTDVISFEEHDPGYLGEIFISIDRLIGQAKEFHHGNERECAFLICHGILHLLGYDHQTPEEEVIMFALQEDILERCGYRRQNNG